MTKDEAKHRLRKEGYNVVDDNSVVTVLIPVDASVTKTVKEIEDKLKAYGYEASFAVKQVADGKAMESASADSEDDLPLDESDENISDADENTDATKESEAPALDVPEADSGDDKPGKEEDNGGEIEYFDEDDSDMLLTEEAVQFSLDDFGLDY